MSLTDQEKAPPWLGMARLMVGAAQGFALFWLSRTEDRGYWPATSPEVFSALAIVAVFVPLIAIGGLGALRRTTLSIWLLVAAVMLAWIGWHDQARGMTPEWRGGWPTLATFWAGAAIVFIAHHLIAAGDEARTWIAPYERYFDLGWRHAAQVVLACAFTGAFWILLYLGASLFKIINITLLEEIIRRDWFYFPATSIAFAAAIHMTDLLAGLVRGFRALSLMLLSWLMPIMAILAGAFLGALPFTGLDPLWGTRAAGAILLSAAAVLIVLINAAYQDGAADTSRSRILRVAARLAALLLAPLTVLAAIALWLRVAQHGWSPDRIQAAALIFISGCYAAFYLVAAFWRPWIKLIERANLATACVVIGVLFVLFTPIMDPARLAVAQQVDRLRAGAVSVAEFDYVFLQFDAGRYGREAAERLIADRSTAQAQDISLRMATVARQRNRWEAMRASGRNRFGEEFAEDAEELEAPQFALMAGSAPLPEGFTDRVDDDSRVPFVLCRTSRSPCEARVFNYDSDPEPEVIVAQRERVSVYDRDGEVWVVAASGLLCTAERRAQLREGAISTTPSETPDLMIGGTRVPMEPGRSFDCFNPGP